VITYITQCPECSTRFKVSEEQLSAHNGMVRCGRCSTVFNATEHLHDDEPSPQLTLPIAPPEEQASTPEQTSDISDQAASDTPPIQSASEETETLAQQVLFHEEPPADENAEPVPTPRRWPWRVASLLLSLALIVQAAYFYRIEIASRLPGLKPALSAVFGAIPLPKKAELMSIESSDMEADPHQTNVITLTALLHNNAEHTQAYPHLELSLTDLQDKIAARRTFSPSEYLKTGEDVNLGLAANRETSVRLRLDTTDLNPAGYKLFLFYPQ